ncbi:MAG: preprotein translocase subunit SecE [Nitrospirae bacterium GWC2_42_7]|nr:MAG: preprotein translocase subunit SecE [Nitrospirae bacterium GWC2_42_7]
MIERIKQFFREVKVEAGKVSYPSKDELIGSTWVVIITVFVVSIFLSLVDLGLTKIVETVLR